MTESCRCVWATDHLNYQASFSLSNGVWTCNRCQGQIQPAQMPTEFRDDAALLRASPAAYRAKYALVHP